MSRLPPLQDQTPQRRLLHPLPRRQEADAATGRLPAPEPARQSRRIDPSPRQHPPARAPHQTRHRRRRLGHHLPPRTPLDRVHPGPARPSPSPTHRHRPNAAADRSGVDLGVKHLAALSTGEFVPNPRAGAATAAKLRRAHRELARTRWRRERDGALVAHPKGQTRCAPTRGRSRAQARVARLQSLLAEQRAQTLHRLTKRLAIGHELVAVEDLHVAGMTRSARGTPQQPGRNVRAKARIALAPRFAPPAKPARPADGETQA